MKSTCAEPKQQLVALLSQPTSYHRKGAAHEAFTKLFSEPLSQSAYKKALADSTVASAKFFNDQLTSKRFVDSPSANSTKSAPSVTLGKRFSFGLLEGTGIGFVAGGTSEHAWPQLNGSPTSISIQPGLAFTIFHICFVQN